MRPNVSPLTARMMIEPGAGRTIAYWLGELEPRLRTQSDTARLDAQHLLAEITKHPLAWVMAHPEYQLGNAQTITIKQAIAQLHRGTPLPYITGKAFFYNLEFFVSPAVLIPRPETELLIDTAIHWCSAHRCSKALDIGTGSGCIAITLARHLPGCKITATDISPGALVIARQNAENLNVAKRIHFLQGDLAANISGQYEMVCTNLPYIPSADLPHLPVASHEPALALDGGADGLELIRLLLAQLPALLAPVSCALLEIEYRQGAAAYQLAQSHLPQAKISIEKDLAGNDRLLVIHQG